MGSVAGQSLSGAVLSKGVETLQPATEGVRSGVEGLRDAMTDRPVLHVLVVDDDAELRQACVEVVAGMGCVVVEAESVPTAQAVLRVRKVDILLLDLRLPGGGGLMLLEQVKALYPETGVVVMTAFATVASAVEAMRIGAGGLSYEALCIRGPEDGSWSGRASGCSSTKRAAGCGSGCALTGGWETW